MLYFLFCLLPLMIIGTLIIAICSYAKLWGTNVLYPGYYALLGVSVIPVVLFVFLIGRQAVFVKKQIVIREARTAQLILRMRQ